MPNVVQSAGFCPQGQVNSVNGSLPAGIAAGNLLVAFGVATKPIIKPPAPQLDSISDSAGLTWASHAYTSGKGNRIRVWSAVAPAGGSISVTVTPATAPDLIALALAEFAPDSGRVWNSDPAVRVSAPGIGSVDIGTQVAATSPIVTGEDGLIAALTAVTLADDDDMSPVSGWDELFENEFVQSTPETMTKSVNLVWRQTSAGTYVPTWNITDFCKWAAAGVAFRDSAP